MSGVLLATAPAMGSGGRRCGVWVTPWVAESAILDTRTLGADSVWESRVAGGDPLPDDCVLLLVHPSREVALRRTFAELAFPCSGAYIADVLIGNACRLDPDLAKRLHWSVR